MEKKRIKDILEEYGFKPKPEEIDAIYDTLEETNLPVNRKYDIVIKYSEEALVGMVNRAVELSTRVSDKKEEETPTEIPCDCGDTLKFKREYRDKLYYECDNCNEKLAV